MSAILILCQTIKEVKVMEQGLKSTGIRSRGGFRHGSGRKRGEPSTRVSVPNGLLHEVRELIRVYRASSGALDAVGCNEIVSLGQSEEPLVSFPDQSIEAELPVPGSEHTPRASELAKRRRACGSDTITPRMGNTGITSTVRPDDALSELMPFSTQRKRLATLKAAPSRFRRLAIKDFGSLEQAAKEFLAYDRKSNGIVVFDPDVFADLLSAHSGGRIE
jgi:hypothetical protein